MVILSTPSFHSLCEILEHLEQSSLLDKFMIADFAMRSSVKFSTKWDGFVIELGTQPMLDRVSMVIIHDTQDSLKMSKTVQNHRYRLGLALESGWL